MLRRLWENWKSLSPAIGNYQSRILLGIFYFLIVTPFGVAVRMFGDPLHLGRAQQGSGWVPRQTTALPGLEESKRQF